MMAKHQIIIVDDDPDDREIIKDAMGSFSRDHEFIFFENGDALCSHLKDADGLPSIILLDLNMPGKDGRESLLEIKSDERLRIIPVIVLTTSSSSRDKTMAYETGANCFLTKPDTFDKLKEIMLSINRLWLQ